MSFQLTVECCALSLRIKKVQKALDKVLIPGGEPVKATIAIILGICLESHIAFSTMDIGELLQDKLASAADTYAKQQ